MGFTIIDAENRIPGFIRAQLAIALFAHKIPINKDISFIIYFLISDRETYKDLTPKMRAQLLIGLVTKKLFTKNWAREQAEFLLNQIVDNDLRRELTNIINGNLGDEPIATVARIEPVVATPHRVNPIAALLPELRQLGAPEMRAQVDNNLRRELTNIINENPGDEQVAVIAQIEPTTVATSPRANPITVLLARARKLGIDVYHAQGLEDDFLDPINYTIMEDPVDAGDGHNYNRNSLLNYFQDMGVTSIDSIYHGCGTIHLKNVKKTKTNLYINGKIIGFLEKLIS